MHVLPPQELSDRTGSRYFFNLCINQALTNFICQPWTKLLKTHNLFFNRIALRQKLAIEIIGDESN